MQAQLQIGDGVVTRYAAVTDFREIFTEEMHSLYLLSFLLTADKDKAEQCFILGLGECLEGIGGFMEWAVGAARDYYQAGHSNDEARPGERGSLAARQRPKHHGRFSQQQPFGRNCFTFCL
jgi:hypothetical protein